MQNSILIAAKRTAKVFRCRFEKFNLNYWEMGVFFTLLLENTLNLHLVSMSFIFIIFEFIHLEFELVDQWILSTIFFKHSEKKNFFFVNCLDFFAATNEIGNFIFIQLSRLSFRWEAQKSFSCALRVEQVKV